MEPKMREAVARMLREARIPVTCDEPLSRHTSLGIGGTAAVFATVRTAGEAAQAVRIAGRCGLPVLVLGGGTNVLVADSGVDALVLHPEDDDLSLEGTSALVGAGASVAAVIDRLVDAGIAGLEFAAGLPGTCGGAVAGNAGCFGVCFGERMVRAQVIDPQGEVAWVTPDFFAFDYRRSAASERGILVWRVVFDGVEGDRDRLRRVADEHVALRRTKHPPPGTKTAGSYFKNLPPEEPGGRRRAAGALLDAVGAKQECCGDAAVYEKHANIIVNRGAARAEDVLRLEARLRAKVRSAFSVDLEPEVRFWGERPAL